MRILGLKAFGFRSRIIATAFCTPASFSCEHASGFCLRTVDHTTVTVIRYLGVLAVGAVATLAVAPRGEALAVELEAVGLLAVALLRHLSRFRNESDGLHHASSQRTGAGNMNLHMVTHTHTHTHTTYGLALVPGTCGRRTSGGMRVLDRHGNMRRERGS